MVKKMFIRSCHRYIFEPLMVEMKNKYGLKWNFGPNTNEAIDLNCLSTVGITHKCERKEKTGEILTNMHTYRIMKADSQAQKGTRCKKRCWLIMFLLSENLSKYILNGVLLLCDLKAIWWILQPLLHWHRTNLIHNHFRVEIWPHTCLQTKSSVLGWG